MKKKLILASFLALAPFAKGQLLLEALEGGIPFTPSEKCLERVYDKHYGYGVHNYIYCAVQGPNGKKWLNLNLGAEYAKESSPHFNPEASPTDSNDWKAFGNLYQWGRDSDGHEQVEYRRGDAYWEFRPINGVRSTRLAVGEQSNQMVTDRIANTYAQGLGTSWVNSPCPNGYHIATTEDIKGLGELNYISGSSKSTTLFGNTTLYPNLRIMTTVSSGGLGIKRTLVDGWNVSNALLTTVESDFAIGTSQLWLTEPVGMQEAYVSYAYKDRAWVKSWTESWARPGTGNESSDGVPGMWILDRGMAQFLKANDSWVNYYAPFVMQNSLFNELPEEYRYLGSHPEVTGIRCVQD